ncbi:hypothetical protein VRU48_11625 [Pedobacter sp. KR3-3]|uniref:Carboxypeptidase-like regulatory domain-containing protein n=1 Tax=Pedobacter albus TaxID=3113905 RepID=A0ABU7I971_9SPHI|nr:hypothetical protein [Pedobacter sp. KR3-3]MEE1945759.1 hypothetical protein [Pedobacter sp. KR3-3]
MKTKILMLLLLSTLGMMKAKAQNQLKGEVFAQPSRKPINQAEIINLNTKEQAISNAKGEFVIKAALNDLLVFKSPGYRPDTLLLINLKPLRRYLALEINTLNTVFVKGMSLREQYAQDINRGEAIKLKQGRGLLFYPSAYFSREGRNARRFKRMLKQEELELPIDRRFNAKTVTAILPIRQPELDAFLVMYRPSLKFVRRADVEDFKSYLLDSYRKFKQLPPEKRILPSLKLPTDSLN